MKIITGFGDYPPETLWHLAVNVATNIDDIPIWATLQPTAAEIRSAAAALRAALDRIGAGRRQAIELARAALAQLLSRVAVNAPQIPNVSPIDLAQLGLPLAKTPVRQTTPPGAPQNFRVHHGLQPGEVDGDCESMGRTVRGFVAQWTLDPTGDWTDAGSFVNSRSFRFTGLARGKDTWFRVAARNVIGQGPWSDSACLMVI